MNLREAIVESKRVAELARREAEAAPKESARQRENLALLLKKVSEAPLLGTYLGCGFIVAGHFQDRALAPHYWTRLFLTLLWVPLLPLNYYLVSHPDGARGDAFYSVYQFHAALSGRGFVKAYGRSNILGFGAALKASTLRLVIFLGLLLVTAVIVLGFRQLWRS